MTGPKRPALDLGTLRGLVSPAVWARGQDYAERGLVSLTSITANRVVARVEGGETYCCTLAGGDLLDMACSCPAFQEFPGPCKHLVATALTLVAGPQRVVRGECWCMTGLDLAPMSVRGLRDLSGRLSSGDEGPRGQAAEGRVGPRGAAWGRSRSSSHRHPSIRSRAPASSDGNHEAVGRSARGRSGVERRDGRAVGRLAGPGEVDPDAVQVAALRRREGATVSVAARPAAWPGRGSGRPPAPRAGRSPPRAA
jgi:SWIM zinc finger